MSHYQHIFLGTEVKRKRGGCSAPTAGSGARTTHLGESSLQEARACLTHKLSEREKERGDQVFVKMGKGTIEFKRPGAGRCGGGERGEITEFSRQARKRMMIELLNSMSDLQWWQTFTFTDDLLTGKALSEKVLFSSHSLKIFKYHLERSFPGIKGYWRREWEQRKSGALKGEWAPHFHMFFCLPGLTEHEYQRVAIQIAMLWVNVLGSVDQRQDAVRVACHFKSYQWLSSRQQAIGYASKYMAKIQGDFQGEEKVSLGKMWGKVGDPGKPEYQWRCLDELEDKGLRRMLRRYVESGKKTSRNGVRFRRFLRNINAGRAWIIVRLETIRNMFWHLWGASSPDVDSLYAGWERRCCPMTA